MKVAVYYDGFEPFHQFKDPGLICLGLKERNIEVSMITLEKEQLKGIRLPFDVIQVKDPFADDVFRDFNICIVYSWISAQNTKFIEHLKSLDKVVIIKSDSDGRAGVIRDPKPRFQNFYRKPIIKNAFIILLKKIFYIGRAIERSKLKQIEFADYVVIESPEAAQNLIFFLSSCGREDLISKVRVIIDPVSDDISNSVIDNKQKENIIVAIGRWEDTFQKNTKVLIKTLGAFLDFKNDWKVVLIGSGEKYINKYLSKLPEHILKRITVIGPVSHDEIKKFLLKSKILFMPSKFESFGIVGAESLCCGCSVVGTPIEPLKFLTMQGFSGTLASSFDVDALVGSLVFEVEKYERGEVDSVVISDFWKKKLNKSEIAKEFIKLFMLRK